MVDPDETRQSLLLRLGDPTDRSAWEEFTSLYWPIIYRLARKRGLQDADAQDLAQKILVTLSRKIADWKPSTETGAFRGWLSVVTRNVTLNMLTRRKQDVPRGGTSMLEQLASLPEREDVDREFELEYRRSLFRMAADEIRSEFQPSTWSAFWLTAVEGLGIEEAAEYLGLQIGSVYAGRSRVMRRLKQKIQDLETSAAE
jgi:RNA polymerase sigma-70 factor (ECF subfamily)